MHVFSFFNLTKTRAKSRIAGYTSSTESAAVSILSSIDSNCGIFRRPFSTRSRAKSPKCCGRRPAGSAGSKFSAASSTSVSAGSAGGKFSAAMTAAPRLRRSARVGDASPEPSPEASTAPEHAYLPHVFRTYCVQCISGL